MAIREGEFLGFYVCTEAVVQLCNERRRPGSHDTCPAQHHSEMGCQLCCVVKKLPYAAVCKVSPPLFTTSGGCAAMIHLLLKWIEIGGAEKAGGFRRYSL